MFWMDHNMPEPSLDPPPVPEQEPEEAVSCKRCAYRETCEIREEWGNSAAEFCEIYEEENNAAH